MDKYSEPEPGWLGRLGRNMTAVNGAPRPDKAHKPSMDGLARRAWKRSASSSPT